MAGKRLRELTRLDLADLAPLLQPMGWPGLGHELSTPDAAWAGAATEQYSLVGVRAVNLDRTEALVLVAPSFAIPAEHPAATPARTPGAAVVLALWTNPDYARVGLARQVVSHLAARLYGHASCVEVVAQEAPGSDDLVRPDRGLLEAVGFAATGQHQPAGEVLRLDLGSALPEAGRLRRALIGLLPWTRTEPGPATVPASRDLTLQR